MVRAYSPAARDRYLAVANEGARPAVTQEPSAFLSCRAGPSEAADHDDEPYGPLAAAASVSHPDRLPHTLSSPGAAAPVSLTGCARTSPGAGHASLPPSRVSLEPSVVSGEPFGSTTGGRRCSRTDGGREGRRDVARDGRPDAASGHPALWAEAPARQQSRHAVARGRRDGRGHSRGARDRHLAGPLRTGLEVPGR